MKNDDFRICDNCSNFRVHPSGVSERCCKVEKTPFSGFLPSYADERIEGEKTSCKGFNRLKELHR